MSRLFVRDETGGVLNSDHFRTDIAARTAYPFTIDLWVQLADLAAVSALLALVDKDASDQYFQLIYIPNGVAGATADCFTANARGPEGNFFAFTTTSPTVNKWVHVAAVFASATDRRVFLNGAGKGTETTSVTPAGIDRTCLGVSAETIPDSPLDGLLAKARVWDAALTDAEILHLARQGNPALVTSGAIVHAWPMPVGETGAAEDTVGTLDLAEQSVNGGAIDDAADPPSVALSGTIASGTDESHIVAGGRTIVVTLTNDTWVAAGATFDAQRQNIIDGLTSLQSEATGWNAEVRDTIPVTDVMRTSDTVVTITLSACSGYDITAPETIRPLIPGTVLASGLDIFASPEFTVDDAAGGGGGDPPDPFVTVMFSSAV